MAGPAAVLNRVVPFPLDFLLREECQALENLAEIGAAREGYDATMLRRNAQQASNEPTQSYSNTRACFFM